jgi:hypothetical protein
MINKEFLGSCSDEQIERAVEWTCCKNLSIYEESSLGDYEFGYFNTLKYCSSPNDTMPIAFANGLSLAKTFNDDEYYVSNGKMHMLSGEIMEDEFCSFNPNPLRAICEVYILMSQKEAK